MGQLAGDSPDTERVWEVLMSVSASPSLWSRLADSRLAIDFGLIAPLYSCPHGPLCAQMPAPYFEALGMGSLW